MTKRTITPRPGRAAIAAVLALASTTAFAQDAAPTIVLPGEEAAAPAPAPQPAPQIVVPEVAPVAAASVEAETTATTTAAPAPRRATTTVRTTASRSTTPRQATAAPAISTAAVVDAVPVTAAPLAAETSIVPEPVAEPALQPLTPAELSADTQREDITEALAMILGGLLLAGVSVGALVLLMRSRRRSRAASAFEPTYVEPVRAPEPKPEYVAPRAEPGLAATPAPAFDWSRASTPLPASGAAVALPRVAPTDPVERGELLKRMVAAEPDRANPFTSPKARLRRARLILQSLGRKFESSTPRFDLSQYTSNWPALARTGRIATA